MTPTPEFSLPCFLQRIKVVSVWLSASCASLRSPSQGRSFIDLQADNYWYSNLLLASPMAI